MSNGDAAIDLLKSIDASLKQLLAQMRVSKPKEIASDADLDGQYGDPTIKAADPRDWTGPSQKGKRFSECSSEYLNLVADRLDYFADVAEREGKLTSGGKPVAPYNRKDAARARGWAARVRSGRVPQQRQTEAAPDDFDSAPAEYPAFAAAGSLTDDDIPF